MDTTLFRGATVLTLDGAHLECGDVLVDGAHIAAVAEHVDDPPGADVVDARGTILIPGLVDTHRHVWEALLRGSAPAHTLADYMSDVLGRVAPELTPDDLHVGTLLGARAAVRSGVTTVQDVSNIQDTPAHTDAIVAAHRASGLRTVFGYGMSYPALQRDGKLSPDSRRVRTDLLPDDGALVTMSLISDGQGDDADRHNADLARELDVRMARHVAAPFSVDHLKEIGALVPGTTFIHGNGFSDADLDAIALSGGGLSVSPFVEMIMGHGYPVIVDGLARGVTVSLSADVEVTVPADLFTQMRAAYGTGRHAASVRGAQGPTVRDVLRMATLDGARTLGLDDRTGSITPGKQADLVLLRADRPDVAPVIDPYSTVVLQCDRSHVDTVLVAGRAVVRAGLPVHDDGALVADARNAVRRLSAVGALPRTPERTVPVDH